MLAVFEMGVFLIGAPAFFYGVVWWLGRNHERKRLAIARVLSQRGEQCGIEIAYASQGQIGRGAVYSYLRQMGAEGIVLARQRVEAKNATDILRVYYRLSPRGHVWLREKEEADAYAGAEASA